MAGSPASAPNVPQPPKFASAAEERLHRKRMLAAAFRLFSVSHLMKAWPATSRPATLNGWTISG